jgi:hypothetical protein
LILGDKRKPKYKRRYTRGCIRKVKERKKSFKKEIDSSLKYPNYQDHLDRATMHIATIINTTPDK